MRFIRQIGFFPALLFVACSPAHPQVKTLTIRPKAGQYAGTTFYTNSHALLVGIRQYKNLPKDKWLDYADKDVLKLREELIRHYGFLSENIIVLLDEQATLENIQKALGILTDKTRVQTTDRLLIYFSCHGQAIETPAGGKEGFLIPYDAKVDLKNPKEREAYLTTCLPMQSLWAYMESSPARHSLALIDACFGGILARAKGNRLSNSTLTKLMQQPAYQALTAGGQDEEALEDPKLGHSAFTFELLKTLEQYGMQEGNAFMTVDLYAALKRSVTDRTLGQQTPQFGNHGSSEGEFVFVSTEARHVPDVVTGLPVGVVVPSRSNRVIAVSLLNKADVSYGRKEYREAERLLRLTIEADSTFARAYLNLGIQYLSVNENYSEAETFFRQAIKFDPKDEGAYIGLGLIYENIKKDYEEAERIYRQIIAANPEAPTAYLSLGDIYFGVKKDAAEAEHWYQEGIKVDPKNASAYVRLGRVYVAKRDYAKAERWFHAAIGADPKYASAYYNLAMLYQHAKKDYVEAERWYRKTVEVDPKNASAYYNLGKIYNDIKKDVAEAERWYREGIKADPKFAAAYNDLGLLYAKVKKDYVVAERLMRQAIDADPKNAICYANLAWVLLDQGKKEEAKQIALRAWDLGLTDDRVFERLGIR